MSDRLSLAAARSDQARRLSALLDRVRTVSAAGAERGRWTFLAVTAAGIAGAAATGLGRTGVAAGVLGLALVAAVFALRARPGAPTRTDPTTGCLDGDGFEERLRAELATGVRRGEPSALILVELSAVPGAPRGGELLRWAAARLGACTRPGDVVAHLGSGEFALLLPATVRVDALAVAGRARDALGERGPVALGLAAFPEDGMDAPTLWHHARAQARPGRAGPAPEPAAVPLSWADAFAGAQDRRMTARHDHGRLVADHAAEIARRMGWPEPALERLRLAAFLHDVGKVAVPDRVLAKPGPLTPSEFGLMAEHPTVGARMVERVEGLEDVAEWVLRSHERYDGSGYPDGLAGAEIPEASRILLVCDAFDAMVAPRPYQLMLTADEALAELRRHAGTQFDPDAVAAFHAYVEELRTPGPGEPQD